MEIKTRVPGVITEVKVKEGDHVDVKTQVATIEAMKKDFSWETSAKKYETLYDSL